MKRALTFAVAVFLMVGPAVAQQTQRPVENPQEAQIDWSLSTLRDNITLLMLARQDAKAAKDALAACQAEAAKTAGAKPGDASTPRQ